MDHNTNLEQLITVHIAERKNKDYLVSSIKFSTIKNYGEISEFTLKVSFQHLASVKLEWHSSLAS